MGSFVQPGLTGDMDQKGSREGPLLYVKQMPLLCPNVKSTYVD